MLWERSNALLSQAQRDQEQRAAQSVAEILNIQLESCLVTVRILSADHLFQDILDNPDDSLLLEEAEKHLALCQEKMLGVLDLGLIDSTGRLLVSSDPVRTGNFENNPYFQKTMQGQSLISKASLSSVTGKPSVSLTSPVRVKGLVRGVLYATLELETLQHPLKTYGDQKVLLLEMPGMFLMHPDSGRIFTSASDQPWVKSILNRKSGALSYTADGKEWILGFAEIPLVKWIVAIITEATKM